VAVGIIKAYLKKSPATYRIIAQKTESGKQIPEGTLIFDASTSTLNIAIGKAFDNVDPASVFNNVAHTDVAASGATQVKVKTKTGVSKSKNKLMVYTASKTEQNSTGTTGVTAPASPNTQQ